MALRTELQSFKREAQKVVKRRRLEESWSQDKRQQKKTGAGFREGIQPSATAG